MHITVYIIMIYLYYIYIYLYIHLLYTMYVRTYYNWTSKQLFGNPRVRACFRFLGHFFRFRQEDTLCSVNMHINQVTHD